MRRLGGSKVSKYARSVPLGDTGTVLVAYDHAQIASCSMSYSRPIQVITVPDGRPLSKNPIKRRPILILDVMMPGYETQSVRSSARALEVLSTKLIGAVLLDLLMPHMDGFEVIRHIR